MYVGPNNFIRVCEEIDAALRQASVRPEDVTARTRLLQPLEDVVATLSEAPQLSDSSAVKIAFSIWSKNNPQKADLDLLLKLLNDESPLVRLAVTDGVASTLEAGHQQWSDPQFSHLAREVLQEQCEEETSPVVTYNLNEITSSLVKTSRPRKRKRPKLVLNPYVAGLPVQGAERFFGREDVLREIENGFSRREGVKSIVLYGARRTGKTSILYQIKQGALGNSFLPVYIDMQAFAGSTLAFFLQSLLLSTEAVAFEHKDLSTSNHSQLKTQEGQFPSIHKFFSEVLSELENRPLLLMIDEYELLERFFEKSSLDHQIQSLLQEEPRLYAIFAGSQKIETLKEKGFFHLLDNSQYIKISFLEREEALQLIKEPAKGLIEYANDVPELILKYTGGHPFYTQLLCQSLFDLVKAGGTVKGENVRQAVRQFLRNPSPHLVLTWNGLDLEQKVIGAALADLSADDSFKKPSEIVKWLKHEKYPVKLRQGEVQRALNALRDIDWVEKEEGTQAYRYTMELVRRWIGENRSLLELIDEQRTRLYLKVGGFWRQLLAWGIDLGIFSLIIALLWIIVVNASANWHNLWGLSFGVFAAIYFMLPPLVAKSTTGQRLLNLRIVTPLTGPLSPGRAFLYGLMNVFRFLVMASLAWKLWAVLNPQTFSVGNLIVFLVAAILTALDILLLLFSKKRQGLYDILAGTLVISASDEE